MKRNFLPPMIGISMLKSQFCFCTGCTPYQLRKLLHENMPTLSRLGYTPNAKLLMPSVILWLCEHTGLQIDMDLLWQTTHSPALRGVVAQPDENE